MLYFEKRGGAGRLKLRVHKSTDISPPAVVQPSVGAAQIAFVDIDRLRGAHRAGRELEERDAAEGLRRPAWEIQWRYRGDVGEM